MPSDAELLVAWQAGDARSGSILFDRHFATVRRFFANKTGREVEDLVQATFEACVAGVHRFEGRSSFRTYVLGIAHNLLRAHYRDRMVDTDELASVADLGAGPSTFLAARAQHRALLAALRRIPMQFQVILELYYWEQLSGRELGELFGVPEATARTRLRRGKELLSQALSALEEDQAVLESTSADLDRWAREIREQIPVPT